MTNQQLYLAIGVPIVVNVLFNGLMFIALHRRIPRIETSLKALRRAD